ncbi:helix-turn-helix domain-containing protein [Paenibacillus polymyxa]|uniref:helix-turn-helix domain-containing protein n=1 Tax=Paenibacillus polymyxa TaxID=1406 RepID=UPI0009B8EC86|nr:helix-turn-helix domain-containing protein [Paenibacillus polymyxa]WRL61612.1 helix-turn-helix domain-containing protein [Paenibacillus polymyxa]
MRVAIRPHIDEEWTYRSLLDKFGIADRYRLKQWLRKYKELGEFGLLEQRGRRKEYVDRCA